MKAKVKNTSLINDKFIEEKRYRLVIIDESFNLKRKDEKKFNIIKDYLLI